MQFRRGPGEIQIFRHSHEIPQMTQFHIVADSLLRPNALATGQYLKGIATLLFKYWRG
jgi:hypothetical protein